MSGFSAVAVVADQTPCSSFVMGSGDTPTPVTATAVASEARSRKVTRPSTPISGDTTATARWPRPPPCGATGAGAGAVCARANNGNNNVTAEKIIRIVLLRNLLAVQSPGVDTRW